MKGFLPDVMRIDSAVNIPVGTYAYNGNAVALTSPQAVAGAVILTGGRKIEDDVADIRNYVLDAALEDWEDHRLQAPSAAHRVDHLVQKSSFRRPGNSHPVRRVRT